VNIRNDKPELSWPINDKGAEIQERTKQQTMNILEKQIKNWHGRTSNNVEVGS